MLNTWIGGSVVAALAGMIGFFAVLRSSAFAAHAIPQSAFAGAAAAALLGLSPLLGLAIFSGLAAVAINRLGMQARHDVATALAMVLLLGLGALFLGLGTEYAPQVYALLFGQILGVSDSELIPLVAVSGGTALFLLWVYRPLLLSSVVEDVAGAAGVRPWLADLSFLLLVAAVSTVAIPVVGALLLFSLMIGPAAAARYLVARPLPAVFLGAALALGDIWMSIALAYLTGLPIGFFVGMGSAVIFVGALALGSFERRRTGGRRDLSGSGPNTCGEVLSNV